MDSDTKPEPFVGMVIQDKEDGETFEINDIGITHIYYSGAGVSGNVRRDMLYEYFRVVNA